MSVEIASAPVAVDALAARDLERSQVNEVVVNEALASKGSGADAANDALLNMRRGPAVGDVRSSQVKMELGKNLAFTMADNPNLLNVDASMRSFNDHDAVATTIDDNGAVVRTSVLNDASGRIKAVWYADVVNAPQPRELEPKQDVRQLDADENMNSANEAELARLAEFDAIEADHAAAIADARAVEAEEVAAKQAEMQADSGDGKAALNEENEREPIDPDRVHADVDSIAIEPSTSPDALLAEAKTKSELLRDVDDAQVELVLQSNGLDIADIDDVEGLEEVVVSKGVDSARDSITENPVDAYIAPVTERFTSTPEFRTAIPTSRKVEDMTYIAPRVNVSEVVGVDDEVVVVNTRRDRAENVVGAPTASSAPETMNGDDDAESDAQVTAALLERLHAIRDLRADVRR